MNQEVNVLALVKGKERYVFLYNEANRSETLRTLGRYASDPELSFTWYDAAVLGQKIRRDVQCAEIVAARGENGLEASIKINAPSKIND